MGKKYTAEEKLELVLAALRNEASKAELCRQRGLSPMSLDAWIKRFVEGGKASLTAERTESSMNGEVARLQKENERLQHALQERELDIRILKKVTGQLP